MSARAASRRWRIQACVVLCASAMCIGPTARAVQPVVKLFPLTEVRLLDGPFKHAEDVNRKYMLAHDPDRLLAPFRTAAGLPPKAEMYPDWERAGMGGHLAGHYLSALSMYYASTGDAEIKKRLDYMVSELADCQKALGDGYVGGIPNSIMSWDQMAAGTLVVNDGFHLNGLWVPWYNLHKTFAGLRDAWLVAGNAQARDVLVGLSDWCEGLTGGLLDDQMAQMLDVEHGGMNEVLADVSEITGNKKYLKLAQRFTHHKILDPLLAKQDVLDTLHANTNIPKVVGFVRTGELADDPAWIAAGRFFWNSVVNRRTVAIGGHGVKNYFQPAADFSTLMETYEGPESCATHNMLRLTEQLYRFNPDPKFAEFYERALFNHILSSQNPETGGLVYDTAMAPRGTRVYSKPELCTWCCVGTGMQSHSKHGRFIYASGDHTLYVNLFIASELNWADQKVKIRQETSFPDVPRTRLVVSTDAPAKWTLQVRSPGWVRPGEFKISVNGEPWKAPITPESYVAIEREWHDGDRVDVEMPMHTSLERLPDGKDFAALLSGPIVLAAKVADPALAASLAVPGAPLFPRVPLLPISGAPKLVGSDAAVLAGLRPVANQPLTFTAADVIRPAESRDLELIPFFRVHDSRYMIYWPIERPEE